MRDAETDAVGSNPVRVKAPKSVLIVLLSPAITLGSIPVNVSSPSAVLIVKSAVKLTVGSKPVKLNSPVKVLTCADIAIVGLNPFKSH